MRSKKMSDIAAEGWYLRDGTPVKDYKEIEGKWSDMGYKVVKQEYTAQGYYWVSTVWLGLDHNFARYSERANPDYRPVIFETMVFVEGLGKEKYHQEMVRYETEEQALVGHAKMLKRMQAIENRQVKKIAR